MQKSVYSVVLMDDVVAAVDRLAYAAGTSRSNMMNRILAEYTSLSTPETQMQRIFSALSEVLGHQSILQPMLSASDSLFTVRSALQYKYNPSLRYTVELYPRAGETFGALRASLRTQNPALLLYLSQFYHLWAKLEAACLEGGPREWDVDGGRFTRQLCTPAREMNGEELGNAIADYVCLFDSCLKTFFEHLDEPEQAPAAVRRQYTQGLDSAAAQL